MPEQSEDIHHKHCVHRVPNLGVGTRGYKLVRLPSALISNGMILARDFLDPEPGVHQENDSEQPVQKIPHGSIQIDEPAGGLEWNREEIRVQ